MPDQTTKSVIADIVEELFTAADRRPRKIAGRSVDIQEDDGSETHALILVVIGGNYVADTVRRLGLMDIASPDTLTDLPAAGGVQ